MKVECENWRVRVEISEDECCRVRAGGTITKREALPNNAKRHVKDTPLHYFTLRVKKFFLLYN